MDDAGCSVYGRTIFTLGSKRAEGIWRKDDQRFLCISSYEKGQDFMRQCAELGVKPTLLTVEKLRDAPWPREVLEDVAHDAEPHQPRTIDQHRLLDGARTAASIA